MTDRQTSVEQKSKMHRFISWLGRLTETRNTRAYAVMRRALSENRPEDYTAAAPYVEAFLGNEWDERDRSLGYSRERRTYYLIAALYCLVNRADEKPPKIEFEKEQNFGWTVAFQHRESFPQASENQTSLEQRFLALMQSDDEQFVYFLRQMINQVKEQPINWVQLGDDLLRWPSEKVRNHWIQSFYRHYHLREKQGIEEGTTV